MSRINRRSRENAAAEKINAMDLADLNRAKEQCFPGAIKVGKWVASVAFGLPLAAGIGVGVALAVNPSNTMFNVNSASAGERKPLEVANIGFRVLYAILGGAAGTAVGLVGVSITEATNKDREEHVVDQYKSRERELLDQLFPQITGVSPADISNVPGMEQIKEISARFSSANPADIVEISFTGPLGGTMMRKMKTADSEHVFPLQETTTVDSETTE